MNYTLGGPYSVSLVFRNEKRNGILYCVKKAVFTDATGNETPIVFVPYSGYDRNAGVGLFGESDGEWGGGVVNQGPGLSLTSLNAPIALTFNLEVTLSDGDVVETELKFTMNPIRIVTEKFWSP
ncbi:hypothetical protein JYT83_01225 [bacterium AH-315-F18]|nr:hypothetical protein [bacterium AH-315-F18]